MTRGYTSLAGRSAENWKMFISNSKKKLKKYKKLKKLNKKITYKNNWKKFQKRLLYNYDLIYSL